MKKWGVRLIGLLFFIRAISDIYALITYTGPAGSFTGWVMEFSRWNVNTDFMGWVEIAILIYAGVQLLRFHPSGRLATLALLWVATLSLGGFLIWMTVLVTKSFYFNEPIELSHTSWFGEVRGPIPFLLLVFGAFVIYAIPTYYLTRKDVKQLFEKNDTPKETAPVSDTTLS